MNKAYQHPNRLRVLAIGNSFSVDCMEYLWQLAKSGGLSEIILGNLYYGGCSLHRHLTYAREGLSEYTYYKNTDGEWRATPGFRMEDAIADEDWDIITLQETSRTCGLIECYEASLSPLIDYVRAHNQRATLLWNATWAYQKDSTHTAFANYGCSQERMLCMTLDCLRRAILPEARIAGIIPCTVAIQNARTSFLGDTLTRDGYHLDKSVGRYVAGLTWYAALTGREVERADFNPDPSRITPSVMKVSKEAAANAILSPLAVTRSRYGEETT